MSEGKREPAAILRDWFSDNTPETIAVAVSGGSDSLALLSLFQDWKSAGGPRVSAVTVNHNLRSEAAEEAAFVSQICANWGIHHTTLSWRRTASSGNLPDQARRGRYGLMARWASEQGIKTVAVGHTEDDQAETFLMRLARGAGVDGLAAMRASWLQDGVRFVRPLLSCSRADLRDHLRAKNTEWIEDPTNLDAAYERSRVRSALPGLGISARILAEVADHIATARDALEHTMLASAREIARMEMGDVLIEESGFGNLPSEIQRRLMRAALHWINGEDYAPRGDALGAFLDDVQSGRASTLQGCYGRASQGLIRLTREANAVKHVSTQPGEIWDHRWRLTGPDAPDARIAMLGEAGLQHCPDRDKSPLPARSLMASPAVWDANGLVAAPLAGLEKGWRAELVSRGANDFASQIAH